MNVIRCDHSMNMQLFCHRHRRHGAHHSLHLSLNLFLSLFWVEPHKKRIKGQTNSASRAPKYTYRQQKNIRKHNEFINCIYSRLSSSRSRKIYVYNGDVQPHLCSYLASLAGREWSGGGTAGAGFGRVAYEVLIQRMRKQLRNNSETPDKFINKSSLISLGLVEHGRTKISETLHSNLGRAHLLHQLWRSLRVFLLLPFVGRTWPYSNQSESVGSGKSGVSLQLGARLPSP